MSNPPLTLPVTNFDLRGPNSYWDDAVGGYTNPYPGQFETGIAALWSGVTGTGEGNDYHDVLVQLAQKGQKAMRAAFRLPRP